VSYPYKVSRSRRGEWQAGTPHPGFDEFDAEGKLIVKPEIDKSLFIEGAFTGRILAGDLPDTREPRSVLPQVDPTSTMEVRTGFMEALDDASDRAASITEMGKRIIRSLQLYVDDVDGAVTSERQHDLATRYVVRFNLLDAETKKFIQAFQEEINAPEDGPAYRERLKEHWGKLFEISRWRVVKIEYAETDL
jgi:hypothetical protein